MDIIFGGVSALNILTNYKVTYRWLAKFYVTTPYRSGPSLYI